MTFAHSNLRSLMLAFIAERRDAKLGKLKESDAKAREAVEAAYEIGAWLQDAARRAPQIQVATHIVKPSHPEAKGTNLRVRPTPLEGGLLGTHSLGDTIPDDAVGNAAALDVYKFLSLEYEGRPLLSLAIDQNPEFLAALSPDPSEAQRLCSAFASMVRTNDSPASDKFSKQVYFPLEDGGYHLLSPLFPTSLVHAAQSRMRDDRFGEKAKAARDAHFKGEAHPQGYREYPRLAIRKFGGTKPQNISQLNSVRYGENWLLASLPPRWNQLTYRSPLRVETVFGKTFGRQGPVRDLIFELRSFLETEKRNNVDIRERRASLIADICEETISFASCIRNLPPGWSAHAECRLHQSERLWLDPRRALEDSDFATALKTTSWQRDVSQRFAHWLNQELSAGDLEMGDPEHLEWTRTLATELQWFADLWGEEA